jgi:hypothetical protein
MIKVHVCQLGEQKAYRIIKQPVFDPTGVCTGHKPEGFEVLPPRE